MNTIMLTRTQYTVIFNGNKSSSLLCTYAVQLHHLRSALERFALQHSSSSVKAVVQSFSSDTLVQLLTSLNARDAYMILARNKNIDSAIVNLYQCIVDVLTSQFAKISKVNGMEFYGFMLMKHCYKRQNLTYYSAFKKMWHENVLHTALCSALDLYNNSVYLVDALIYLIASPIGDYIVNSLVNGGFIGVWNRSSRTLQGVRILTWLIDARTAEDVTELCKSSALLDMQDDHFVFTVHGIKYRFKISYDASRDIYLLDIIAQCSGGTALCD